MFELVVILLCSVFLTLTFDVPMQNVRDFLMANWHWEKEPEPVVEPKDPEVVPVNGQANKKSSEALFKSSGNLDSSNFDWSRESKGGRISVDRQSDREVELNAYGAHEDHLEDDEIEMDEDEFESEQHGGNSLPVNEELDDIWGSDK